MLKIAGLNGDCSCCDGCRILTSYFVLFVEELGVCGAILLGAEIGVLLGVLRQLMSFKQLLFGNICDYCWMPKMAARRNFATT